MIRCPLCSCAAIYVVEATLAETGAVLTFAPATVALEPDGFYFSLPVHEDSSTTAEVAECAACGRCGPLADFGFGEAAEPEADEPIPGSSAMLRLTPGQLAKEQQELVIAFDQPEARGTVILRKCAYGLELILPDVSPWPVAVLDFWHTSEAGQADRQPADPAPVAQIIVHSPAQHDDPLGRVRFFPAGTVVDFERDVAEVRTKDGRLFGYDLDEYPPIELLVRHQGVAVYRALAGDGRPCPGWFTSDPDKADLAADGPHFRLADITAGPAEEIQAAADPAILQSVLRRAIAAGQVTAQGLM